jgi:hypothetical protein
MSVTFFPLTTIYPFFISSSASRRAQTPLFAMYLFSLISSSATGAAAGLADLFFPPAAGLAVGLEGLVLSPASGLADCLAGLVLSPDPAPAAGLADLLLSPSALTVFCPAALFPGVLAGIFPIVIVFQGANLQLITGFLPDLFRTFADSKKLS